MFGILLTALQTEDNISRLWAFKKLLVKDGWYWYRGRCISLAGVILIKNKEDKMPTVKMRSPYSDTPDLKGKLQDKFIKLWVWANNSNLHLGA